MGLMMRHKHYTPYEDRMIKRLAMEVTAGQIAVLLSRTEYGIKARAKKLGVTVVASRRSLRKWQNELM